MSINNILNRYRGGPDFKKKFQESFYLDRNIKLNLTLPQSNPRKPVSAKTVNYPFTEPGWFEMHCSRIAHSQYIPILEVYWYYMPFIPLPFDGELGSLRLNIEISKLSTPSLTSYDLGRTILKEYDDYYNSDIVGDYNLGRNTEIINDVAAHSALFDIPFSEEKKKAHINAGINDTGYPKITDFEEYIFNEAEWIKYTENRENNTRKKYVFATLLDEHYYMTANFTFTINMSHSGKSWYKNADANIIPMMEGISLTHLEEVKDNLLVNKSIL